MKDNIFDFIIEEETNYKVQKTPITDGWEWNMYEHLRKSTLYKNSKFAKGNNDGTRPFKNIIRPILNVGYRSEGFDVKDIEPFVNNSDYYFKSFLTRKFHDKWARNNDIDTFIDELVESYVDYGLALVKNVNQIRPVVVPLPSLAFCDQTDILSGPICEKYNYSISELRSMAGKWYKDQIELAITFASPSKDAPLSANEQVVRTPGKYIEVYEVHGTFPETWLNKESPTDPEDPNYIAPDYTDSTNYIPQMHIVCFYKVKDGDTEKKKGICLYKGKEPEPIYKAIVRDKIFGRACGFGGIEELFEAQTWTNYSEIKIKAMLDSAALMILQTADKAFKENNRNLNDIENNEVLYHEDNKPITQVVLQPQNIEKFNNAVDRWENQGRTTGSANDPLLGEAPTAGTPFKLQDAVIQEGQGIHQYRQGKISTFVTEIYRDWTLKHLADDMMKGQKFIDELTLEELQTVADNVATIQANNKIKEKMLPKKAKDAKVMKQSEIDILRDMLKEQFMKGGMKRFIEIMKDEMKDLPMDVYINIAGKQKDLAKAADKLTNIFREIFKNPAILQDPAMAKLFNEIIESSGFSPITFSSFTKKPEQPPVAEPLPVV